MNGLLKAIRALSSNWLTRALGSSIGNKIVMAITGLGLCGFLVVHLSGNLLLYAGAEKYNRYSHALHAQETFLLVAEIGLAILFLWHIAMAISTKFENDAARPEDYAMRQSKQELGTFQAPAASVMWGTGIIVFLFLVLHLMDFRLEVRHRSETQSLDPFDKALVLLSDPLSAVVYAVGSLVLGYHVLHGFQSAFHSLGIYHPKYTPLIKFVSLVFAIVVAVGFASFPLWVWARK